MPESPDTNLDEIENKSKTIIEEEQGEKLSIEREPVAFGINSIILTFARNEDLDSDDMLEKIQKIQNVSSAEIIDFRRAFG